ncbi:MAG: anthranilate synthase component I [Tepidisphaerales bacterium]
MPRYFPDLEHFTAIARDHQLVPVYRQLLSDHLTPVTAFELLASGQDHAFLLESVVGNEKIGRYSFIATSPVAVYEVKNGRAVISRRGQVEKTFTTTDPLADLQQLVGGRKFYRDPKLPAFTGGLVGYAGYDTIRYYEGESLPRPPRDDRHLPDLLLGLYEALVVFDQVDKTIRVIANADVSRGGAARAYIEACERVDAVVQRLSQTPAFKPGEIDVSGPATLAFESNFTRDAFEKAVESGKEYIRAGDIFQFVPSQRLRAHSAANPFDVYRALRIINPSPFMFYLRNPSCTLIGASPEILCQVLDRKVTSRPLAGTRRRGATEAEDLALEKELLADPKERAEHIMLVDLHRNDIGRVARVGTVHLSDVLAVERYSHVMHISTNVTGILDDQYTALDALRVSLPVGTVSGAPKIRAMQIIDELEPTRRGPYGGAAGYLDYAGNLAMCIAMRTIVYTPQTYDIQAGAGIVADSVPASEYEETMSKARALLKAVELAERGF